MRRAHLISVPAALALAAAGLTATAAHADGAAGSTLYVAHRSAACSDTAPGAGSQALPFCTVQAAANAARAGQTIKLYAVGGDTYTESVTFRNSGTPSAPITVDGSGDYLQSAAGAAALTFSGAHDVVLRNLQVVAAPGRDAVDVSGSQRVTIDQSTLTSRNTVPTSLPADAVAIDGSSSDITVSRSQVTGSWAGNAVHAEPGSRQVVVTTDEISGFTGTQPRILLDGATGAVTGNTVLAIVEAAVSVTGGSTAVIENNELRTTGAAGLSVSADSVGQVTADYNGLIDTSATAGAPLYSWGGTAYPTRAAFQLATHQGAHDNAFYSGANDSADSDAPGELATDRLGHPRAQDPNIFDTGAGTHSYYDRGAIELEDQIGYAAPGTAPVAAVVSSPVDEQPTPVPTSAWKEQLTATVDFGDGTVSQPTPVGTAILHAYTQPGEYNARTTVTNTDGYSVSQSRQVEVFTAAVEQPVLTAKLFHYADGSYSPGTEDVSIGGTTLGMAQYSSFKLTYGDGSSTTAWDIEDGLDHVYSHSGTYPLTLTTVDLLGRTATAKAGAVIGADYLPLTGGPKRVYDSRSKGVDSVPAHGTVRVHSDTSYGTADAMVLNLTVADTKAAGYVTAYPDATTRPTASTLDFTAGGVVANQATVRVGATGWVDFYNGSNSPIDIVVDQLGTQILGPQATDYHPGTPTRVLDTRSTGKQIPGHGSVTVQVPAALLTGPGPVSVVANVTAVRQHSAGYATVYTAGESRPGSSNLDWTPWVATANLVTATADAQGRITVYNGGSGAADFLVDFVGYYRTTAVKQPTTGFVSTTPTRVLDTRYGTGAPAGPLQPGKQVKVCFPGTTGMVAAALNLTVTGSKAAGYLVAYPDGGTRPGTSNVNWNAGQTVADMTQPQTGADGCVQIYNGGAAPVSVIADLSGYQVTEP